VAFWFLSNGRVHCALADDNRIYPRSIGGERGTEFLLHLARETGVVLLPAKRFEIIEASVRVSLANLTQADYEAIGDCSRRILDELFAEIRQSG
jgi:aspartate 4-decarboxylase